MRKIEPISKSRHYRNFIAQRDRVLEQIMQQRMSQIDAALLNLSDRTQDVVARELMRGSSIQAISNRLEMEFMASAYYIFQYAMKLRIVTYTLAYSGEVEAIGRALGSNQKEMLRRDAIERIVGAESPGGGTLKARIDLGLSRVKRKVIDAIEMSRVLDESAEETLNRVGLAFPRGRWVKRPGRELKSVDVREADDGSGLTDTSLGKQATMTTGFIDDDLWGLVVQNYRDIELPPRGSEQVFDSSRGYFRHEWEVEQELTQDFVSQVRSGQVAAARENGITDFVWIAVVDDKTDICCLWRDGLRSSQIRAELDSSRKDDECQTDVPPAHFNCRCTLAPATDNLPETEKFDYGEFDTWLNS